GGNRYAHPASPLPKWQLSELRNSCATLTNNLVQKIGQAKSSGYTPFYGAGKHTDSHGGAYPGSVNSHHKDGHYQNPVNGTRTYGRHK
ncbi:MAG: hypothetical protein M3Y50_16460, partial [Acidobacteriota bacterium]|nr:hypothetical protein [Acidobacteriota bacterium]